MELTYLVFIFSLFSIYFEFDFSSLKKNYNTIIIFITNLTLLYTTTIFFYKWNIYGL